MSISATIRRNMKNCFNSLYMLLTTPVPVPWGAIWRGFAVLMGFLAAEPFDIPLMLAGLSAAKVALLCGFLSLFWRNMGLSAKSDGTKRSIFSYVIALLPPLVLCAFIIFVPTLKGLQQVMTYYYLGFGLMVLTVSFFGVGAITTLLSNFSHWKSGQVNAARVLCLSCFAQAVLNELVAGYGTTQEWILAVAVLPVVSYYLYVWTVIATHPYNPAEK